ncbi:MAG: hypothetical protein AAFZ15_22020 [Bacteroidota bacterium]
MDATNNPRKSGSKQTPLTSKSAIPSPPPPNKPNNTLIPILLSIGFLMLVGIAWMTYKGIETTRALEQKVAELQEAEKLRVELENQYNEAITELDALKSDNEQINALIDQQKAELMSQKNDIANLMRDKRKYDAARAEIRNLKERLAGYVAEIEQLQSESEMLAQENVMLKDERDQLNQTLQAKLGENEELTLAKAQLVNEKEDLAKSVEIGSVVQVKGVKVTPQKVRKSGKTADQKAAKRTDQLKVCFTTIVNELAKPGTEKFFIRIINPSGETLAIDDLGSGIIKDSQTGEQVQFTQVAEYDYMNDETQLCFNWKPDTSFDSGNYEVEIYNKGYLAGKGNFSLK